MVRHSVATAPMPGITTESPLAALKSVVLEYLRSGCAESDCEPQFPDAGAGYLPWNYTLSDEWDEVTPPAWHVVLDGDPVPLTETRPGWLDVPLRIIFRAPLSADEDWLQSVESRLVDLLEGVWHVRETGRPAENTPLAIRLTSVAAAMDPAVRLLCASATISHPQRVGTVGNLVEVQSQLTIRCAMFAA